jgi:hypothetical protein
MNNVSPTRDTELIADDDIVGIETDPFGIDTATSSRLVSEQVQAL